MRNPTHTHAHGSADPHTIHEIHPPPILSFCIESASHLSSSPFSALLLSACMLCLTNVNANLRKGRVRTRLCERWNVSSPFYSVCTFRISIRGSETLDYLVLEVSIRFLLHLVLYQWYNYQRSNKVFVSRERFEIVWITAGVIERDSWNVQLFSRDTTTVN